ncbi:MAG: DUF5655 domain-containing protein [Bacilli bacterium]
MLYSLKGNKIKALRENDFRLEKEIQHLVETNIDSLLGLNFVSTEFSINNFRIDTLGFDKENNAFIIIEYKRGRNESLIDQGYTYLNILLDRKADFVLKYNEIYDTNLRINDIDWAQSRVIFISPKFTDYQIKANDFKNNPIDLIQITRYENDIIEMDKIKKNSNIRFEINGADDDNIVNKVDKEIKVYTEDDHLIKPSEKIKEVYYNIRDRLLEWDNVEIQPKKLYIAFKGVTNITDIELRSKDMKIFINLKKGELDDPKQLAVDCSEKGHWGNGDYEIIIKDDSEIEYILSLIRQALNKNKK